MYMSTTREKTNKSYNDPNKNEDSLQRAQLFQELGLAQQFRLLVRIQRVSLALLETSNGPQLLLNRPSLLVVGSSCRHTGRSFGFLYNCQCRIDLRLDLVN